jgi:DNA-binding CsgD family transcriptional regulator
VKQRGRPPHPDVLTDREWEVYYLLRMGLTNQQIGDWLGISFRGAKFHVSEIMTKLGVESRRDLRAMDLEPRSVRLRRDRGVVPPPAVTAQPALGAALRRVGVTGAVVLVALLAVSVVLGGHPNAYVLPAIAAVSFAVLSAAVLCVDLGTAFARRYAARHRRV